MTFTSTSLNSQTQNSAIHLNCDFSFPTASTDSTHLPLAVECVVVIAELGDALCPRKGVVAVADAPGRGAVKQKEKSCY